MWCLPKGNNLPARSQILCGLSNWYKKHSVNTNYSFEGLKRERLGTTVLTHMLSIRHA